MKKLLILLIGVLIGGLVMLSLNNNPLFPSFGTFELADRVSGLYFEQLDVTNTPNIVTAIVVGYRSFDTLGEITVLFISALGVGLLVNIGKQSSRLALNFTPNFMLRVGSRIVFGLMMVLSFYIIIHGHLTPGGGFQGGAIIASGLLLLYLADDAFRSNLRRFKLLESSMGILLIVVGLIGLIVQGAFYANVLPLGVFGDVLSGGILPLLYVFIGLKVGAEIAGMIDHFLTEEASK